MHAERLHEVFKLDHKFDTALARIPRTPGGSVKSIGMKKNGERSKRQAEPSRVGEQETWATDATETKHPEKDSHDEEVQLTPSSDIVCARAGNCGGNAKVNLHW